MAENLLGRETSPYLLQHKDNPVAWRSWGPAALAEARAEDKPILLSVGYAACHWCHVMAHESFEDKAIAALVNRLYIPIKVDREERPDLDAIYQQALSLLGEQGGWPLTMFLTPNGEPFWGGTYYPPVSRWGRPGFAQVLQGVERIYRQDPAKVGSNVRILADGLAKLSQPRSGGMIEIGLLDQIVGQLARAVDPVHGGIGKAPKFPNCSILELLWRGWKRTRQAPLREAVFRTLDAMSQGGIYDHLGGGYARYSTDERWLVPHFEKMLYDNGQIVDLLCWAWQDTQQPLYRRRIEETIGWLLREMRAEGGAFASTIDADSEHEEGKFYVWTEAEIDRLLGPDAVLFKAVYDVTPEGNWEGSTILNRLNERAPPDAAIEAILDRCRAVLLAARAERIRPDRDDKVLADWNGLMIAALAGASEIFERDDWLTAATEAWDFVVRVMTGPDGRLCHSWRLGRSHPGTLDDHADMIRAALALHQATGEAGYLDQAILWTDLVELHYRDPEGGYFFSADDTETLIARTKSAADAAVPAGNGVLLQDLARLHVLTGEDRFRDRAERLIAAFSGEVEQNFFPLAAYLNGIELFVRPLQIVVISERSDPAAKALIDAIHGVSLPNLVLTVLPSGQALPPLHPAAGKTALHGRATAYVCEGPVCSAPLTDPTLLAEDLRRR